MTCRVFAGLMILLFHFAGDAQVNVYSPLTRIGFGDLVSPDLAHISYTGRYSAAFKSMSQVNLANPASFGAIRTTIYDVGISAQRRNIEDSDASAVAWTGNISYLSVAFPLKNSINAALEREESDFNWGLGINLTPFSSVGYEIQDVQYRQLTDDFLVRNYTGNGGTYRATISNGASYKNFSFGLNFNVLFGSTNYDRQISLNREGPNGVLEILPESFITTYKDQTSYTGVFFEFGAQYDYVLDRVVKADGTEGIPDKYITFGATFRPQLDIGEEGEIVHSSAFISRLPIPANFWQDTILSVTDNQGDITLPASFSVGVAYTELNKLKFGVNFIQNWWSDYTNELRPEPIPLKDSWSLSGGVSITPDAFNPRAFYKRITYSAGFFYNTDPRTLNGAQVDEVGASLGLGIPVFSARQEFPSLFTIGVTYGRRGVDGVLTERYWSLAAGMSLTDSGWFRKRKYL